MSSNTLIETVKNQLIVELYCSQLSFWNTKLQKLAKLNAEINGYTPENVSPFWGGIVFKGQLWSRVYMTDLPEESKQLEYYFLIDESDPALWEQMEEITEELLAIKREKYETERFLSGLSMFDFPPAVLQKILGNNMFSVVRDHLPHTSYEISPVEEHSLMTYVNNHRPILEHMNERILLNLITLDSFN